jgi:hypothetical protein
MTHRDRARNASSSRAVPWKVSINALQNDPVVPIYWGAEQSGMQTGGEIGEVSQAIKIWLEARDDAVKHAQKLSDLGVHKSLCNRITEPYAWIHVVMSATEWRNFFNLRCHKDAEIHFQRLANVMKTCLKIHEPKVLEPGEWHLPYTELDEPLIAPSPEEKNYELLLQRFNELKELDLKAPWISTARCARVSYITHGDTKRNVAKDYDLALRLKAPGHWSPFEHPAQATPGVRSGPYNGWRQFRKFFDDCFGCSDDDRVEG